MAVQAFLAIGFALGGLVAGTGTAAATGSVPGAVDGAGLLLPAMPFDCVNEMEFNWGGSLCRQGGGEHRAVVRCDKSWAPDYNRYGPWRPNGEWSRAICEPGDTAFNLRYETSVWT